MILCIQVSATERFLIEAADRRQERNSSNTRLQRHFLLVARIIIWPVSQRGGSGGGV